MLAVAAVRSGSRRSARPGSSEINRAVGTSTAGAACTSGAPQTVATIHAARTRGSEQIESLNGAGAE